MRAMIKPNFNVQSVFEVCVNSVSDEDQKNRLCAIADIVVAAAANYDDKASNSKLFQIPADNCKKEKVVAGLVTNKELSNLYSSHMVGKNKPARRVYDALLAAAPNGLCPSCGFGHAFTLDHYLPKGKFPLLSVVPYNLVPACRDCNTGKNSDSADTAGEQVLHAYYDHQVLVDEQWLFAIVEETSPVTIRFYVAPPENWSDIAKHRVVAHFSNFNLSLRFSIEAANELSSLNPLLSNYVSANGYNAVKEFLEAQARELMGRYKNSWRTAMYQALASNVWYCDGGYRL